MRLRVQLRQAIGGLVVVAAGFCVAYVTVVRVSSTSATSGEGTTEVNRSRTGREIVAIFIGSSTCGASAYPGLPEALNHIKATLGRQAEDGGHTFVSIGIALDADAATGLDFLERFGPFDEVLAGGGWLNTGALEYIVRDLPSQRAIPQLVLLERDIVIENQSISTVADRLTGRKIGSSRIVAFSDGLEEAAKSR